MKLSVISDLKKKNRANAVVVFIDDKGISEFKCGNKKTLHDGITADSLQYFTGDLNEVMLAGPDMNTVLCGTGDPSGLGAETLRNCGAAVVSFAISKKIYGLTVIIPSLEKFSTENVLRYIAEGMSLANYRFGKYKTQDNNTDKTVERIEFISSSHSAPAIVSAAGIIAENTFLCRDLVNDTTDEINPVSFAKLAGEIAMEAGLKFTALDKKMIVKKKMGLLVAVNRGSAVEPRVVVLEYAGDPKSKKVAGLVGKGITFDSGGMDLKPPASMETMRSDMSGAAAVLCVMKTLSELKVKKNVTAVIPLTENMLSNSAYRPGDVFSSYSGKTVEIGNTDAEGRLILADALAYMEKEIKPDVIIDMATLTGACVVTFGETVAAYLSTDDRLAGLMESASADTGEKLWRLPLFDDYEDRMKSDIADLSNMSSEKNAGTIAGAVFLKKFIEKTPWLHIDIAGTSWYSKARGYRPKNATGYGLRLLVDFINKWS